MIVDHASSNNNITMVKPLAATAAGTRDPDQALLKILLLVT
jgi:hypothetical protein